MVRTPWNRDELLLACALVAENDWKELRQGDIRVLELSDLLRTLPLHPGDPSADPRFRSPDSVSRKTTDIATVHPDYPGTPTKGGSLSRAVVADFVERPGEMAAAANALREGIASGELLHIPAQAEELGDDGKTTAREGQLLARWALHRERDRGLRTRKIRQVQKLGLPLRCEVCAFDFGVSYGQLGAGYVEVHHITPLHASGPRWTALEDLALLCANCHRMCHRSYQGRSWRTPAELRDMLQGGAGTAV
ncbi:HNH endonuclease [Streptomyces sp. NPDC052644]